MRDRLRSLFRRRYGVVLVPVNDGAPFLFERTWTERGAYRVAADVDLLPVAGLYHVAIGPLSTLPEWVES